MALASTFIIMMILVLGCGRKAGTGRRCDLGFVVVMLSLVLLVLQLQSQG
jgi:hypothetical protein